MADTVSPKRRKEIMSHIKSQNTSIELLVRKQLFAQGYRYRVNYKKLPGKPDIVFTKKKLAIFIHGCFWHGHDIGCHYSHIPQSRTEYWIPKINRTKQRDCEHLQDLSAKGWKTLVIWECEIYNYFDKTMNRIIRFIENS